MWGDRIGRAGGYRLSPSRPVGLVVLLVLGLIAAACADDAQTEFTSDNRSGFMAACSLPLDDTRLVGEICQCVFDATQAEMEFGRFEATDARLEADPDQPLPDEIAGIIADCVISETGL